MTLVPVNALYFFAALAVMFWVGYLRGVRAGEIRADREAYRGRP